MTFSNSRFSISILHCVFIFRVSLKYNCLFYYKDNCLNIRESLNLPKRIFCRYQTPTTLAKKKCNRLLRTKILTNYLKYKPYPKLIIFIS